MATVFGMGAIVGPPMRMPQTLLSLFSSPRAPFPGQMCLGSFWVYKLAPAAPELKATAAHVCGAEIRAI